MRRSGCSVFRGSRSSATDKATSELVERGTYQAYGGAESDYRPERWKGFREDYGFTGKEEDVEVGLKYFGKRYYAPLLNRWVSADPLAVHVPGKADANAYAYVRAQALQSVDPFGLDCGPDYCAPAAPSGELAAQKPTGGKYMGQVAGLVSKHLLVPAVESVFGGGSTSTAAQPGKPPIKQMSEEAKMLHTAAFFSGGKALSLLGRAWRSVVGTEAAQLPVGRARLPDVGKGRLPDVGEPPTARFESTPELRVGDKYLSHFSGEFGLAAEMDKDGMLDLYIKVGPNTPRGGEMFQEALARFGDNVRGIRGRWMDAPGLNDNFAAYKSALSKGGTPEQAAFQTFTGHMAQKNGFTTVKVVADTSKEVTVEFTRK